MKYVFGHKNPDTDSILSALVMTEYLNKKKENAEAFRQGDLNKEVKYILDYLKIDAPKVLPELKAETKVVLVDHNDPLESIENLDELIVTDVVDHHAIKLNTSYPLNYRCEAVGCTNTILYKMFKEAGLKISEKTAIMMLSAIISDSLLFKSPTFTDEDEKVVDELKKLVSFDVEEFGLKFLKAGTDLSDLSEEELINFDAKLKEKGDIKFMISQVNTVDIDDVLKREDKIKEAMKKEIKEKDLSLLVFLITDIINANSMAIVLGDRIDAVVNAFGLEIKNDKVFLEGVVSRKKQVLPQVEEKI